MTRGLWRLAAAALLLAAPASAQDSSAPASPARPFGVGERLEYDIRYGKLHVGNGSMEVLPMDTVRGREVWHTVFRLHGGIIGYRVNDRYEVWFDPQTLASLRYWQDIDQGRYEPKRHYEIFPERKEYIEGDKPPRESVERPLVDVSFFFLIRTLPLRVGMDTSFNDYFMAERNPIRFRVLRKERIKVPAGEFNTIVVQPIFESKLFAKNSKVEVWLSDDENRIMLQMKSNVRFGSFSLYLESYHPSPATTTPLNRVTKP